MTSQINARREDWPPRIDELQREMERFFSHLHTGKRPRVLFSTAAWSSFAWLFPRSRSFLRASRDESSAWQWLAYYRRS